MAYDRSPLEIGAAENAEASSSQPGGQSERRTDIESADTEISPSADAGDRVARRGVPLEAGDRIGRFTVLEVLGRGGMGIVLSAYDPQLDRRVAIKLVSAPGPEIEQRDRLVREARAMAKLRHPNVVTVYEVGEHEGQVFFAMEQVEGGTLRRALRDLAQRGAAGWRRVLPLLVQAGQGLAAAHREGLVHRDFKPDNVFVDKRAVVCSSATLDLPAP